MVGYGHTNLLATTGHGIATEVEEVLLLADPIRILAEMAGTICDMAVIRSMTAEGAPVSEICAAFKPAWHEYRVGLYQKSLRQISEKRLKNAMEFCLEADRALKLSPQGYTALEQLICKF